MNSTRRRSLPRVPTWFPVRIFDNDQAVHGVALNISAGGFYLESKKKFTKKQKLIIKTHLPGNGEIAVATKVAWVAKTGTKINGAFFAIGLKVTEKNKATLELLKKFADTFEGRSFKTRRMENIKVVVEGYEGLHIIRPYNISKGGCYLLAEGEFPNEGDTMNIDFHVPSLPEPLSYVAKVLYLLDEEHAGPLDMRPGFGVEFIEKRQGFVESLYAYLGKRDEEAEDNAAYKS